jgi:hypothetical protein
MQNRYAGDVGDFSKFYLIEKLSEPDLRPAVVWYLNIAQEANSDGNRIKFDRLRKCQPALHDKLVGISTCGNRSVGLLQTSGVCSPRTLFFDEPLPIPTASSDWIAARDARDAWSRSAFEAIARADLIFLDPDNGLAPPGVTKSSKRSLKYAFQDEVRLFLSTNRSVVLYQHLDRKPITESIQQRLKLLNGFSVTWALSFHAQSVRIYYVLAAPSHQKRFMQRSRTLFGTCAFRLHIM